MEHLCCPDGPVLPDRSSVTGLERWFSVPDPHGSSQLSMTPVPGDPESSHRHVYRQNTNARNKKINILNEETWLITLKNVHGKHKTQKMAK